MSAKPAARLRWHNVLAWRVARHSLHRRLPATAMLDVVGRIAGLHAQLLSSAELSLQARVDDLKPDNIQQVLWKKRALIKTWAMRGTLHLLPAIEYPMWQSALSTYQHYLKPSWLRAFGVTRAELERLLKAVAVALDGAPLTRDELADAVAELTRSKKLGHKLRESWGAYLKPAAFRGQLCFAPSRGRNVRFTSPERWLRSWVAVESDVAWPEVIRRYLGAYAPATREDLARWWGLSAAQAGKRIGMLEDTVVTVDVEGRRAWMLADHVREAGAAGPRKSVRLLPAFDPWVIGASRDVSQLIAGPNRARVYRQQGWISPVLLVDGRVDGVWQHERKGDRVAVRIEPFVTLKAWTRTAAAAEAERIAAFLGATLDFEIAA